MGLQWQMAEESLDDTELVSDWLKLGFEPFAVTAGGRILLKKQVWVEDSEKASEVIIGTPSEEAGDADSGGTGRVGEDDTSEEDQ